ncbi:SRPBCC domain-containing protein [Polaribacter porphyrae]|nr:SRPBCC domain-containing protein [Polaribacter porphyrae]
MRNLLVFFSLFCLPIILMGQKLEDRILSEIDTTIANNIVLKQSFTVNVPIDSVWNAYTTKKGWESWATSIAEVDFKINGRIRTNYNKKGEIGDKNTITLYVVNYIPKKQITLQAKLTKNFPEFMKKDEKDLFNIIHFKEINTSKTEVISYGIGYKNSKKYNSLLKFFIQGNVTSCGNLINYLETGKTSVKY